MSHRFRRTAAAVPVLLLGALLGGCSGGDGGGDGGDYCQTLKDEQQTLTDLSKKASPKGGTDVLTPTLQAFERLKEAAPQELQDEWETLVVAYQALADAVQRAGIDPADYRPDQPPPGLSKEQAAQLAAVADKLSSQRVLEAAQGIEDHAKAVCHVDFTG